MIQRFRSLLSGFKEGSRIVQPEPETKYFEKEYLSPDKKRKLVISKSRQIPVYEEVSLYAKTSEYSWNIVIAIARGILEDGDKYIWTKFNVPTGFIGDSSCGVAAYYGENGIMDLDDIDASGWGARGADTPEKQLLFRIEELPKVLDMKKTGEAFLQQAKDIMANEKYPIMHDFRKPDIFPLVNGNIATDNIPQLD